MERISHEQGIFFGLHRPMILRLTRIANRLL